MRKLCMAIAMLCALATATSLAAAERAEFQISPRAGRGVLKLDQFRHVNDNLAEMDTGGSVRAGDYEFGDAGSIAFVMTFSF